MIIESLLNIILNVFNILLLPINIPSIPDDVYSHIETFIQYIATGKAILSCYVPLDYLLILFAIVVAIELAILIYHFVLWVIKKIPFLGME